MNIHEFKKGEIITRTEPSAAIFGGFVNILTGQDKPLTGDRSYMGDKLEFVGVANGMAYFKQLSSKWGFETNSNELRSLELDAWSEGWEYYVNPETLLQENMPIQEMSKQQLEKALQAALDKEDFEKAVELRDKLSKL